MGMSIQLLVRCTLSVASIVDSGKVLHIQIITFHCLASMHDSLFDQPVAQSFCRLRNEIICCTYSQSILQYLLLYRTRTHRSHTLANTSCSFCATPHTFRKTTIQSRSFCKGANITGITGVNYKYITIMEKKWMNKDTQQEFL